MVEPRFQYSADPEEKLEYLREQKRLIELSIAVIEDGIKNPPVPIDWGKVNAEVAAMPRIGEYRDGKYHYFTEEELSLNKETK